VNEVIILLLALFAVVTFLLGFYTGRHDARTNREVIEREVAKIVPTERIVEVEKAVIVQVPVFAEQPKQPSGASLPIMGSNRRNIITDPNERAAADGMASLLSQLPEA
jgi:hypothetical protein